MSVETGRHFLAIPGPTVIPERVMRAMNRPMTNIYEGPLIDLTHSLFPDLKQIAKTEGDCMMYIANGHGAWDAALFNTISAGDTVLVLESGRFAVGWGAQAQQMGATVETLTAPPHSGVDPAAVEAHLRKDTDHKIKAILVVQVDTATGVWNDIEAIRKAIDAANHPALYMVDCIACFGCVPFEMDAWGVDVTVAACQKGLMTPPGLGFVFANEKAMARRQENGCLSVYWDWLPRAQPDMYYKLFCGTAPVNHLYGLREALDMMAEEGLEAVYARHHRLASAVRAAVTRWGEGGPLSFNIADPAARSDAVTTILTGEIDAQVLRRLCEDELSLTLGLGIGLDFNGAFRIGHMGHVNEPMILGVLGTVELALTKMNAPFTPGGVEAAIAQLK
jgi:alanine-glyoxylate transaminase/serine-glyoxylate transaminase/serine-pyruvate transaminase